MNGSRWIFDRVKRILLVKIHPKSESQKIKLVRIPKSRILVSEEACSGIYTYIYI